MVEKMWIYAIWHCQPRNGKSAGAKVRAPTACGGLPPGSRRIEVGPPLNRKGTAAAALTAVRRDRALPHIVNVAFYGEAPLILFIAWLRSALICDL